MCARLLSAYRRTHHGGGTGTLSAYARGKLLHSLEPGARILGESPLQCQAQIGRGVGAQVQYGWRRLEDLLVENAMGRSIERQLSGEQPVPDDGQRILIRATVDLMAPGLLRSHVVRSTDDGSGTGELSRVLHRL